MILNAIRLQRDPSIHCNSFRLHLLEILLDVGLITPGSRMLLSGLGAILRPRALRIGGRPIVLRLDLGELELSRLLLSALSALLWHCLASCTCRASYNFELGLPRLRSSLFERALDQAFMAAYLAAGGLCPQVLGGRAVFGAHRVTGPGF